MFKAKVRYCGIVIEGFIYVSTELWENFQIDDRVFVTEHPEHGVLRVYNQEKQFVCCVYQTQLLEAQIGQFIVAIKKDNRFDDEAKEAVMKMRAGRNDLMRVLSVLEREGLTSQHFK